MPLFFFVCFFPYLFLLHLVIKFCFSRNCNSPLWAGFRGWNFLIDQPGLFTKDSLGRDGITQPCLAIRVAFPTPHVMISSEMGTGSQQGQFCFQRLIQSLRFLCFKLISTKGHVSLKMPPAIFFYKLNNGYLRKKPHRRIKRLRGQLMTSFEPLDPSSPTVDF